MFEPLVLGEGFRANQKLPLAITWSIEADKVMQATEGSKCIN
jgi:hypothetical protein